MRKFIFPLVCLVFFIACLPNKKLSKLPKCVGQYAHSWCYVPSFFGNGSTLLELYDNSTFEMAGSLSERDDGCAPEYFFRFKGTYEMLNDTLLLAILDRQHSYYTKISTVTGKVPISDAGRPNIRFWEHLGAFHEIVVDKVVLHKNKNIEKEPAFYGKGGWYLTTENGWWLSEPPHRIDTIYLKEVDYLPPSFFQKHPNIADSFFYKKISRYCIDSIGKRIDRHRFGG